MSRNASSYAHSGGVRARDGRSIGSAGNGRRQDFLAALNRALLDRPWRAVSVRELSAEVGASAGLFWLYFASLEDCFDQLYAQLREDRVVPHPHLVLIHQLLEFERAACRDGAS
ncbi:MAG TPA: TetR family transcriptional regulator [Actinospica sp.]|jgi:AcrR family transcriptional regulator|nr:TetR family transcriptional regulator [Actinospica sp.]